MPLIIEFTYADGSQEITRIPVMVWRHNEKKVTKTLSKNKEVVSIRLDPMRETADIDEKNNLWGTMPAPSRIKAFKQKMNVPEPGDVPNPMQSSRARQQR